MKFAADAMLGKLAKWLRLIGYDTHYVRKCDLSKLWEILEQDRIFLTRNTKLYELATRRHLSRRKIYLVQANEPPEQLREIVKAFQLPVSGLFRRCSVCNFPIKRVSKETVKNKIPEYTYHTQSVFYLCSRCGRVYWAGSHMKRITEQISNLAP